MTTTAGNLASVLEARAADGGWIREVAFVAGDRDVTHGQVYEGAARCASLLARTGVRRGDAVLIALPDGVEFVWAFLGAVRLGAVAVPVNPRLTELDHRETAGDVGARVVVCGRDLADRFAECTVVAAEDLAVLMSECSRAEAADVAPGDPAYAQFTSGTTGRPTFALHAHDHPLVYFDAFARQAVSIGADDVLLSVSKLYFAYGLGNSLFFPLLAGCRAVLHAAHPRPGDIAEAVRRHGATVLFSVPTFYAHLVAGGQAEDFTTLRAAVSAGESLSVVLAERARALLGCPILDGIGTTEVGQTFASNTLREWRDGTVGRPLPPYRVRVLDDGGHDAAPGQVGALWVAGPTLPLGYDGDWLATGDRALVDEDGFLHLRGRFDDVELVGGISVPPLEIEALLARHRAVTEVAVAAVVGPDGASRLLAFVVAAPGAPPGDVLEAELLALARAELAPFKVPRSVVQVDSLPRTPTGKLRRFVLRSGRWDQPASARKDPV